MDVTSKNSRSIPLAEAGRDVAGAIWAEAAIEPARTNNAAAEISLQLIMFNTCATRFL
jgi:hypothetical protein